MISRKKSVSSSNPSIGRKWILLALVLFGVGGLVGFTYGQAAGVVSHAFGEVVWGTVTGAGQAVLFLKDIKNASPSNSGPTAVYSPNNPTHGINADFLDGMDSSDFAPAGGGGGGGSNVGYYERKCTWMSFYIGTYNNPPVFFETDCEEPDGDTKKDYPPNAPGSYEPPACEVGDITLDITGEKKGIDCYATGITGHQPQPLFQEPDGTGGYGFVYPATQPGATPPTVYGTVGVCKRTCMGT